MQIRATVDELVATIVDQANVQRQMSARIGQLEDENGQLRAAIAALQSGATYPDTSREGSEVAVGVAAPPEGVVDDG